MVAQDATKKSPIIKDRTLGLINLDKKQVSIIELLWKILHGNCNKGNHHYICSDNTNYHKFFLRNS